EGTRKPGARQIGLDLERPAEHAGNRARGERLAAGADDDAQPRGRLLGNGRGERIDARAQAIEPDLAPPDAAHALLAGAGGWPGGRGQEQDERRAHGPRSPNAQSKPQDAAPGSTDADPGASRKELTDGVVDGNC